ncbi:ammonium transporter [Adhaeretor mobilis]|uniref:Ammonium transporter n=1 Tax=Adhaeretor mobilis TaxID=1930276 RepID=A0A517MXT3_9BACT|nr:ammonium transporter [Adhaeretor mobilis]QDS99681.1 Ammonium transporter NrgA [Adhaeretor mobilis]
MYSLIAERRWTTLLLAAVMSLSFLSLGSPSYAQEGGETATVSETDVLVEEVAEEDLGVGYALDNAVLMFCAVLVFLMQAGFAMVEAGFNSSKNAVNILFKNSMDICVGVVLFFAFGFGIMYPGAYGVDVEEKPYFAFGGFGLDGYEATIDRTFSPEVDWLFQAMFAATAATIVSGAVAGRMKVGAYLIYSAILTGLIYPISGMWKWGGGFLAQEGFQDFAGSAVVHGLGGFAGLAGAIVLGPRLGRYVNGKSIPMLGHSVPIAALGVFILWFGWFGFNPGSQLAFHGLTDSGEQNIDVVMHCAMTTTLAAGAGGLVATLLSWGLFGKPDLSMGLNGILGGLVGITACCDCMSNLQAVAIIGPVAGALVVAGVLMLDKLHIDDPVGAFPVHGLCGVWGCLAIGILENDYLTNGDTSLWIQLKATVIICGWSFVTMFVLFSIMKAVGILRVSEAEEQQGLDISEHGMSAYTN